MKVLKEFANIGLPLLGAVLGGPPGLAAGAMNVVVNALGIPDDSSVQDIINRIEANPDEVVKLREIELHHEQYLRTLKLEMEHAELADRADARAREVAITRATGKKDRFAPGLGLFVVLAFTVVLGFMIFKPQTTERDPDQTAIINILVGALTAGYSTVLSYYFGSSAGSKNKDGTIATLTQASEPLNTPKDPPPPDTSVQRSSWRDY